MARNRFVSKFVAGGELNDRPEVRRIAPKLTVRFRPNLAGGYAPVGAVRHPHFSCRKRSQPENYRS
jgi:hypothetical protein